MKKYFFLIALLIGLMACSTAPPPPDVACSNPVELSFDNSVIFTPITICQELVLHPDVGASMVSQFELDTTYQRELVAESNFKLTPANSLVISVDELQKSDLVLFASLNTGYQDDLSPPNSTIEDALNVPKKGDGKDAWLYWGIGLAVLVFYNISQKVRKTEKSWTILGMAYRLFNEMIKDKAADGGNLEIKRE